MSLIARLESYLQPLMLLTISIIFIPLTLIQNPFIPLRSLSTFRSRWFANMWTYLGPKMASSPEQSAHVEELMSRARGVVLELGPGSGDQMGHFKSVASEKGRIQRVYGAEPNVNLHAALVEKAAEFGLKGDRYVALEAAAEPRSLLPALRKAGALKDKGPGLPEKGVFDTIIAVKSMCSVRQSEMSEILVVIEALLKPGGEFIFFEHVENHSDPVTRAYVWLLEWIWPWCMGGCRMTSRLDRVALGMSGWVPSIQTTEEFQGYGCFRYVKGVCRKK